MRKINGNGRQDLFSSETFFTYILRLKFLLYFSVSGYGSGSLNVSMHAPFNGLRAPFTPSQWIELEHQALIYKYITSNLPVPPNLLMPLKKSLNPYVLSGSSAVSLPPNSCKLLCSLISFQYMLLRRLEEKKRYEEKEKEEGKSLPLKNQMLYISHLMECCVVIL